MSVIEMDRPAEEEVRKSFSYMNLSGDTKVTWDPSKPVEVENARNTFNTLKSQGYNAQRTKKNGGGAMTEFDPQAEGLIMVPVMTGG